MTDPLTIQILLGALLFAVIGWVLTAWTITTLLVYGRQLDTRGQTRWQVAGMILASPLVMFQLTTQYAWTRVRRWPHQLRLAGYLIQDELADYRIRLRGRR